jgi:hypothetical protein
MSPRSKKRLVSLHEALEFLFGPDLTEVFFQEGAQEDEVRTCVSYEFSFR